MMKLIAVIFFIFFSGILLVLYLQKVDRTAAPSIEGAAGGQFIQVIQKSEISGEPTYGGVSWHDYDGDGYLDLLMPSPDSKYKLFRNNRNETFTDVTKQAGLSSVSELNAAVFGDYNNDGCPDIYFSTSGPIDKTPAPSDRLWRNNCDGTFADVTENAGIHDSSHGFGVAWADYNKDGYLDLYVANWGTVDWGADPNLTRDKISWTIEPNILYRNNGDGTFTNTTNLAGVMGLAKCKVISGFPQFPKNNWQKQPEYRPLIPYKVNWQPIWFDYNNDGFPDLYVAHDDGVSALYKNNGDGTFTDTTQDAGLCHVGSGMGLTVGDYDEDGDLDLYVTHTGRNLLWRNNNDGTFTEVSEETGVANFGFLGWGTGFFDYDNDGSLDLYAVNGLTGASNAAGDAVNAMLRSTQDQLYRNNGFGVFTEVSKEEGLFGDDSKSAAAFGDYNNDGFTDIFIVSDSYRFQLDGSSRLYKNKPNGNRWLTVQLIGDKSNRDAVGARVIVKTDGKSQMREVVSGSSLLSQNSLWQTFGLGKTSTVGEVEIVWPSGIKQKLKKIKANQRIIVREPDR